MESREGGGTPSLLPLPPTPLDTDLGRDTNIDTRSSYPDDVVDDDSMGTMGRIRPLPIEPPVPQTAFNVRVLAPGPGHRESSDPDRLLQHG